MNQPSFTLYILHSSHTDVGYTDTQEKMKNHHIGFIRQALKFIEKEPSFKWNCESYWCVERFLAVAEPHEKEAFVKAVQSGNIGLSASYLNLTDLVAEYVHDGVLDACCSQRSALGLTAQSAMTADINGYSWGMADIWARHNVKHLMSCIHTHHGYHPLFRKQTPFWWETPSGNRLLVWNGDHYNLGNELGIAQTPWFEYTLTDGLSAALMSSGEKANARIQAYVDTLLQQGYEFDFAPISVSSYMTDNAPPSLGVLEFIKRYNAGGHSIHLQMATLDEFFAVVQAHAEQKPLPAYGGDWTDWWADGVGSTPADVLSYRAASRSFHVAQKLMNQSACLSQNAYHAALENLMFYGEHTWGYSSSITEPYHPQVANLDQWKRLYALKANEAAAILKEKLQADFGETAVSTQGELKFRAVNPHNMPIHEVLSIDLEHFYGHQHFRVVDEATKQDVPFQLGRYSRGPEMCIDLDMAPKEVKTFRLCEIPAPKLASAGLCAPAGIEGVNDLYWRSREDLANGGCVTLEGMENNYFRIVFTPDKGITSIYDKAAQRELVKPHEEYAAFTPIYEVTPRALGEDYLYVRRNMGRNRKAYRSVRSIGRLCDVRVLENGSLYSRAELVFKMEGVESISIILTAYKLEPRLSVDLRFHKTSVWEPENLYLALPFEGEETWIDKAGARLRPRVDQLPGTCVDFYAVQNAVVFASDKPVVLTCPDTPLIWMGSLRAHTIRLMGEGAPNNDETFAWVMNNFWETNFKASLGGFYQFHYGLELAKTANMEQAFELAEARNEAVLQFYLFEDEACGEEGIDASPRN